MDINTILDINEGLKKRVLDEADYIVTTDATLRDCAKVFQVCKTTVQKDMRSRLPILNRALFNKVDDILVTHFVTKHINGGEATKVKKLSQKMNGVFV